MSDVSDAFRALHQEVGGQCRLSFVNLSVRSKAESRVYGALWGLIERVRLPLSHFVQINSNLGISADEQP